MSAPTPRQRVVAVHPRACRIQGKGRFEIRAEPGGRLLGWSCFPNGAWREAATKVEAEARAPAFVASAT